MERMKCPWHGKIIMVAVIAAPGGKAPAILVEAVVAVVADNSPPILMKY